jgi:hypothetical protein
MLGPHDPEFMRNAVAMVTTAEVQENELAVTVNITNQGAGHHLPSGSPLHHMLLVVSALNEKGNALLLQEGDRLPAWAGSYAEMPGRAFAKVFRDELTREVPTPAFWREIALESDTRIPALATDTSIYRFDLPANSDPVTVSATLIYRRAYEQLMEQKGWNDPDILVANEKLVVE